MDSGFLKRLGWYLIGFSIGLVFLVFFIKKKSGETGFEICYFPNCRVLKDLRSKPMTYADNLEQQFAPDSLLWYSFFKEGDKIFAAMGGGAVRGRRPHRVWGMGAYSSISWSSFLPPSVR